MHFNCMEKIQKDLMTILTEKYLKINKKKIFYFLYKNMQHVYIHIATKIQLQTVEYIRDWYKYVFIYKNHTFTHAKKGHKARPRNNNGIYKSVV